MRRRALIGLVLLVLLVSGGIVGAQVGGEPTVATQTFTHEDVVTYTVPTETEVVTETVVSTETVTVTEPGTTTAPPTTTEPPPEPNGTRIVLAPEPGDPASEWTFTCNRPVREYAVDGLPLIIETWVPNPQPTGDLNADVRLMTGCEGEPGVDPDIVLEIHGNGGNLGSGGDVIHMGGASPGPQNLQVTGFGRGGVYQDGSSHPDCVQMLMARNITFHDFDCGVWETQTPGVHCAGGCWYVSESPASDLTNVVCVRCRMVGSTDYGAVGTGFYLGGSIDSGAILSCFSANRPFFQDGQAVRGLNIDNVFVDRDGPPQNLPSDCVT